MKRILGLWAALLGCSTPAQEPPARPNIILILADDLGINDLGCYGRKDHRTPHLDRLASEGLRFTSFYCAQPICSPSRAAIMTGRAPARLRLTTYLPGRPDSPAQRVLHPKMRMELPVEEETLGDLFKRAGYATAAVGKWHLGGKGFGPKEQGFDFVSAAPDQALNFVRENRGRPFFLYVAHTSPHIPLAAKPEAVERNRGAFNPVYAAMIETLDESVGRLLAEVDALKTLVIFTSDNGGLHVPELKDDAPTHNSPFRAGKGFLYEGGLRVPFIARWPGKIAPGSTPVPVMNTDLLPTLAELAGLEAPLGLDGSSFAPLLRGGSLPARPLFWHFPHYNNQGGRPSGAVREGDWKLVERYDDGHLELYNLAAEPGEERDLAEREPGRVEELRRKLASWRSSVGAQENAPNPAFDEARFRMLYVETDVSRLKPAPTAREMTPALAPWRRLMDKKP